MGDQRCRGPYTFMLADLVLFPPNCGCIAAAVYKALGFPRCQSNNDYEELANHLAPCPWLNYSQSLSRNKGRTNTAQDSSYLDTLCPRVFFDMQASKVTDTPPKYNPEAPNQSEM